MFFYLKQSCVCFFCVYENSLIIIFLTIYKAPAFVIKKTNYEPNATTNTHMNHMFDDCYFIYEIIFLFYLFFFFKDTLPELVFIYNKTSNQ